MAVQQEFIDLFIPIATIEAKFTGGVSRVLPPIARSKVRLSAGWICVSLLGVSQHYPAVGSPLMRRPAVLI